MKRSILLTILLSVLFVIGGAAQDKKATTEDGKAVILKADGTWHYADDRDEYAGAQAIIEASCKKEWPDDFRSRSYCIDKQQAALNKPDRESQSTFHPASTPPFTRSARKNGSATSECKPTAKISSLKPSASSRHTEARKAL